MRLRFGGTVLQLENIHQRAVVSILCMFAVIFLVFYNQSPDGATDEQQATPIDSVLRLVRRNDVNNDENYDADNGVKNDVKNDESDYNSKQSENTYDDEFEDVPERPLEINDDVTTKKSKTAKKGKCWTRMTSLN